MYGKIVATSNPTKIIFLILVNNLIVNYLAGFIDFPLINNSQCIVVEGIDQDL